MRQVSAKKKKRFRLFGYFGEIINELKKVVWLTRREIVYLTGMVVLVTIIAGIMLGSLDYGFSELIGRVFIGN
ncbi:MAG: preprotein translocase subunit SecE [Dehalococcoidales bacterium]|nr:preprotein translocase subunit SecE [Dehalococcoidales bacterium]